MSHIQKYISFLKVHPPFNQMPYDLVEKVAWTLQVHHYGVGRTIFRKGEEAMIFYIIHKGVVRELVRGDDGKETVVSLLRSGECFGAISILTGQRRRLDAVVEEDVELYVIYKADLERLFSENPGMIMYFNRIFTFKLNMFFEYFDKGVITAAGKDRSTEELARELSAMDEIARILSAEGDVEGSLRQVVEILREWTRVDACSMFLLDNMSDRLELKASSGFDIPEGKPVIMKASEGITGWVVRNREPVKLENASSDPRVKFIAEIHEERFKSILSVPLVAGGESFGAINFHTVRPRKYKYEEVKGVAIAGGHIALALSNAKLKKRIEVDADILRLEKGAEPDDFVGKSPLSKKINEFVDKAADSSSPVLIEGEAGTGKELIARLIHSSGTRKGGPFLEADCGQFAADSWGAELFGMEGEEAGPARIMRRGYVEMAEGGILFLKNIEKLNGVCQMALFNFLESGFFNRVGSKAQIGGNVRIICSSKASLKELAHNGSFNKNAYEALSRFEFKLEPLRKLKRFVPELCDYLLKRIGRQIGKEGMALSAPAVEKVLSYDWPGNVAELENVLKGAAILTEGKVIGAGQLFFPARSLKDKPVYDLLAHSWLSNFLRGRFFPDYLGKGMFFIFAVLLGYLLTHPDEKFFTSGIWAVGWFSLFLSAFFLGRVFCAVCPFMVGGDLLRKVKSFNLKCPPFISNHGEAVAAALIFVVLWMEGAFGFHYTPLYTAGLLLFIALGAMACSVLFQRRVWCRYLCPMGSFIGTFSLTSFLSVSADRYVCTYRCANHECYVGKGDSPGCQLFLHPYGIESQAECVLCMQCLKNCPLGAVNLNLQFPATGIIAMVKPFMAAALASSGLLGVMPVETKALLGPGSFFFDDLKSMAGMDTAPLYTVIFLCAAVLPALLFFLVERVLGGHGFRKSMARFAWIGYSALPLAVLGHAAFYWKKVVMWAEDGMQDYGILPIDFLSANLIFYALYFAIMILGALGSIHTFLRLSRHEPRLLQTGGKVKAGYLGILMFYMFLYILSVV